MRWATWLNRERTRRRRRRRSSESGILYSSQAVNASGFKLTGLKVNGRQRQKRAGRIPCQKRALPWLVHCRNKLPNGFPFPFRAIDDFCKTGCYCLFKYPAQTSSAGGEFLLRINPFHSEAECDLLHAEKLWMWCKSKSGYWPSHMFQILCYPHCPGPPWNPDRIILAHLAELEAMTHQRWRLF